MLRDGVFEILKKCSKQTGLAAYVVGGFVRDTLLKRPCKDIDVVVLGEGIVFAKAFATAIHAKEVTTFERFGTAMVRYKDWEIEFVGARKESYNRNSRKPIVENGTLADDQIRRDFTINALSFSLNEENYGALIDPFEGQADLAKKIIRTPTNPDITFSDDPLRMMRAIRFATQLGFEIEEKTFESITRNAQRIEIISPERIVDELNKIMVTAVPSVGYKLLFQAGLLKHIFPELQAMYGVEFRNGQGHKDNFYHTLKVLDNVAEKSDNLWLRWVAVLHDIGKPITKRFDTTEGWTFHGHEDKGAKMVIEIFRKLRLPLNEKMKYVQKLVALHQRPVALVNLEVSDSAIRRIVVDAGEDLDDLLLFCSCDITSSFPEKVQRYKENYRLLATRIKEVEEKDNLRNWQPPISGEMIMQTFGLPPGIKVGLIKNAIREAILEGEIPNDEAAALAYMHKIAENI